MSAEVRLKSSHIYLKGSLVETIFDHINYAYVTYVKDQGNILITPITSTWFVKMYKPKQFLLKTRNLEGDKTLAVRELLIDNELDSKDRDLSHEVIPSTKLIKIHIG
jgi:hypothetical protein